MFSTNLCKLEIVPTNVDWLLLTTYAKIYFTLKRLLLFDYIVTKTLEDEITGLEYILPCFDRLAHIWEAFSPNVHGAPIV